MNRIGILALSMSFALLACEGPIGPDGEDGEQGEQGVPGMDGAQGQDGEKGDTGDMGAQGAQGEQGDQGDQGAQGEQGPQGDEGAQGDQGAQGPQGDQGDQGAQGPQGDPGTQGASGVGGVRSFEGDWTQNLAADTDIVPAACTTPSFTASGPNQAAIVNIQVSASLAANNFLFTAPVSNRNGAGFNFTGANYAFTGTSNNTGHVTVSGVVPLAQGSSYVFGTAIKTQDAATVLSGNCHGTVTIVNQ